jgi:1,2-diacylglycerol 3-beta-glucosyltransferase
MASNTLHRVFNLSDGVVGVAAVPTMLAGGYLGALTILSRAGRTPIGDRSVRFCVVIPAHNEETGIALTVANVRALDYPADRFEILVIADNCTDRTAERARGAGAKVHERFDTKRKSKGYALTDVFPIVLEDKSIDVIVVVDADTQVSPNLLTAIAARFAGGAQAVQVDYRVANANDGWRTKLMHVAFTCFHDVRSLGRERLQVSAGLRGNGMAFGRQALEKVPHQAASLVEDLEHGIALAKAGIRVHYVHEAFVQAEMPHDDESAASQRERWERGRAQMRKEHGGALLRSAIRERDLVQADLAADVLLPPITQVVKRAALPTVGAIGVSILKRRMAVATIPVGVGLMGLAFHLFTGWKRSGGDLSVLKAAPGYIRWKSGLTLGPGAADNPWVRTRRIAEDTLNTTSLSDTSSGASVVLDGNAPNKEIQGVQS